MTCLISQEMLMLFFKEKKRLIIHNQERIEKQGKKDFVSSVFALYDLPLVFVRI